MRIAVTGASGFVGRCLATRLVADGHDVRGIVRRTAGMPDRPWETLELDLVGGPSDWRAGLEGVDTVIHLAARTHAVGERRGGDLADYRAVNVAGTRRVIEAAAQSGVRRLVFVSSIKVNGERTSARPFLSVDPPSPEDAYGISKWEAEQVVAEVAGTTGLESVVVRPPLVYGPGAMGNFARLCYAVRRGFVLPFGAVDNRRSLVALDNLVDLLVLCVTHPAAPAQTFLVSDGEELSTPELIRRIAQAMGRRARLLSVPPAVLRMAGRLAGRGAEMGRLLGSLQVNMEHTRQTLGWVPPVTVDEGLQRAVAGD